MPQGKGTYGNQVGRPRKKITKPFDKKIKGKMNPAAGGPDYFSKMKKMRGMK